MVEVISLDDVMNHFMMIFVKYIALLTIVLIKLGMFIVKKFE